MVKICVKCKKNLDLKEDVAYFFNIDGYVCEQCLMKYGSKSQKRKWEILSE